MNKMRTAPTTRGGRMLAALAMALLITLLGTALTALLFAEDLSIIRGAVIFVMLFVVYAWRGERNAKTPT